jgi:hypothetical protein
MSRYSPALRCLSGMIFVPSRHLRPLLLRPLAPVTLAADTRAARYGIDPICEYAQVGQDSGALVVEPAPELDDLRASADQSTLCRSRK